MIDNELTKSAMIEVLKDADKFACDALSAYIHKAQMFDSGEGRFKNGQTFMDAVTEIQTQLRIVVKRLESQDENLDLEVANDDNGAIRGSEIPATSRHGAGAYGRCSYCGRYSDDPAILTWKHHEKCDCGKSHGYSGSFLRPGYGAVWNGNRSVDDK